MDYGEDIIKGGEKEGGDRYSEEGVRGSRGGREKLKEEKRNRGREGKAGAEGDREWTEVDGVDEEEKRGVVKEHQEEEIEKGERGIGRRE